MTFADNDCDVLFRHTAVWEMFCCHAIGVVCAILSTDTGSSHRPLYTMSTNYLHSVNVMLTFCTVHRVYIQPNTQQKLNWAAISSWAVSSCILHCALNHRQLLLRTNHVANNQFTDSQRVSQIQCAVAKTQVISAKLLVELSWVQWSSVAKKSKLSFNYVRVQGYDTILQQCPCPVLSVETRAWLIDWLK